MKQFIEQGNEVQAEEQNSHKEEHTLHAAFIAGDGLGMPISSIQFQVYLVLLDEPILRNRWLYLSSLSVPEDFDGRPVGSSGCPSSSAVYPSAGLLGNLVGSNSPEACLARSGYNSLTVLLSFIR